jgi:dienelactone hydrolase
MKRFIMLILLCLTLAVTVEAADSGFDNGAGSFIFTDQNGDPGKPVKVWYYKPSKYTGSSPILFVMHGMQRNADEYRDQWIKYAEQYGALLLVPEFSEKNYPDTGYAQGNLFDSQFRVIPENKSGFMLIEHLFDYVTVRADNRSRDYFLYGHSAGGQFVHRMLLLKPDARIRRAVAANPGFYTLPRYSEEFPYGLKKSGLTPEALKAAFGKELIILLGEQDTLEHQKSLNKSLGAMKQGKHRFARGQNFYKIAQEESGRSGIKLEWRLQTVAGAGHYNSKMAGAAAQALFRSDVK